MITNFGKFLRKLRVDHNEFLKDMAARLGVTVAYLSAIEHKNNIKINLSHRTPEDRKLILAFTRAINNLSETDKKDIYDILQKRRNS